MSRGNDSSNSKSNFDLDGPLPWRLVVDKKACIIDIGRSFRRICPSMKVGDELKNHLAIDRTDINLDSLENIASIAGKLVIARSLDTPLTLRGTFFLAADGQSALLATSPLVTSPSDLWTSGIQLGDFSPFEPISDLLFAVQARDTSLEEVREILIREKMISQNYSAILDSSFDAMITINMDGYVVSFNNSAINMFGYSRAEAIGRKISELIIPPEYKEAHNKGLEKFRAEGVGPALNKCIEITAQHSDGTTFPIELTIIPFKNDEKQFFTATIRDLTNTTQQQLAIEEGAEQERLLHRELDHRVKNMLATIVVLAREASKHATTDRIILQDLSNRIMGFSLIHELLSKEGGLKLQLKELIHTCIEPYLLGQDEQITLDGDSLSINPGAAVKLVMVINELATNASKHGSLKFPNGRILVNWTTANGQLELTWQEHHSGPAPEELEGGFGTMVLRSSIPYEFNGEVSLEPTEDGMVFKARIPLDSVVQS